MRTVVLLESGLACAVVSHHVSGLWSLRHLGASLSDCMFLGHSLNDWVYTQLHCMRVLDTIRNM
jgi:hypothetical protein